MASVTHHLQVKGSYDLSRSSWNRGAKLTRSSSTFYTVQTMDINLLKHASCLCGESSLINRSKQESFRISSLKGGDRVKGSHYRKNCINIPYISWDNKEKLSGLTNMHSIRAHSTSDADVTTTGSLAIHKLFKKWLTFLPLALSNQDPTLDGSLLNERVETDHKVQKLGIIKNAWGKFLEMDATIKIPAIILIPLFLTVNIKYGAQVAKELSPLWIGGPLLVAIYIKMVQMLYSLYVFSFKQPLKAVKNFTHGNYKEFIQVHLWQHVVYFRNLDYKNNSKRMWKEFQVWLWDKCVDYVESMLSCHKMVRFLKMAKMI